MLNMEENNMINDKSTDTQLLGQMEKDVQNANKDVTSQSTLITGNSVIDINRKFVTDICNSLKKPSSEYKAEDTLSIIVEYLNSDKRLPRILYSEISSNIFALQVTSDGNDPIFTNMDALVNETLSDRLDIFLAGCSSTQRDHVDVDEIEKFVLRVFDHIHLAETQINLINQAHKSSDEAKEKTKAYELTVHHLSDKLDKAQREYITVLGIFATVVVAFMGGMTFSSSVLQTMKEISIYRLVGVIILLGFILFNIINMLMKFLLVISDKIDVQKMGKALFCLKFWKWSYFTFGEKVNFIFSILFFGDVFLWFVNGSNLRAHLSIALYNWLFLDETPHLSVMEVLGIIVVLLLGGGGAIIYSHVKDKEKK